MDCDSPRPQVAHSQHTADDISSQIVEDEHFPYRLAVGIEDGGRFVSKSVGLDAVLLCIWILLRVLVKVEHPFD